MTTLTEFSSHIRDIARANRFLVEMLGPAVRQFNLPDNFKFLVSKAQIPKKDITGPIMRHRGTQIILTGDYKKDPLVLTFWNDIDWSARDFFEDWMQLLLDTSEVNFRLDQSVERHTNDIRITPRGPVHEVLAFYTFKNVQPMEISEIELDMGGENTLQEFTVSFNYSHFEKA